MEELNYALSVTVLPAPKLNPSSYLFVYKANIEKKAYKRLTFLVEIKGLLKLGWFCNAKAL
jgi:hypothetical protein